MQGNGNSVQGTRQPDVLALGVPLVERDAGAIAPQCSANGMNQILRDIRRDHPLAPVIFLFSPHPNNIGLTRVPPANPIRRRQSIGLAPGFAG